MTGRHEGTGEGTDDRGPAALTTGAGGLREGTRSAVDLAVARAQRQWRAPNVSVGVVREGRLVHSVHVGSARLEPPVAATDDTAWLIGSVTKTLTGVLVMALRDEGRLGLDDPLRAHLPTPGGPEVTIRQLLGHVSGLPREPEGRMWQQLLGPTADELLNQLTRVEQVLPALARFHYSNLAFAALGIVIEQVDGRPYGQALKARVLEPLGMADSDVQPPVEAAHGYHVHPWTGVAQPEPVIDLGATAPMGGLWSTLRDLTRYAGFLMGCAGTAGDRVLAPATLEQMCRPVVLRDPDRWTTGHGLSLGMLRRGERVFVGHGGQMPGFVTGLLVSRSGRTAVITWANTTAGASPLELAADLLTLVLDREPQPPSPWRPEPARPELTPLLGSWWSEGDELVFTVREGRLWSSIVGQPAIADSAYEPSGPQSFRVVEGRECGELLELTRDQAGQVVRMHLAGYAVTRDPVGFADL